MMAHDKAPAPPSSGRKGFLIADILKQPSSSPVSQSYPPTRPVPPHHPAGGGYWACPPLMVDTLVRPTPLYAAFGSAPTYQHFPYSLPVNHPDAFRGHHHPGCYPAPSGPQGQILHNQASIAFSYHERLNSSARPLFLPFLGLGRPLSKRKGGQVRFSAEQTAQLEKVFAGKKYLTANERKKMADTLHLSERQVKTWFQNRRAKWRRLRQRDSEGSLDNDVPPESDEAEMTSQSDEELSVGGSPPHLEPESSPLDLHINNGV